MGRAGMDGTGEGTKLNPGAIAGSVASGAGGFASHLLETLLILFYMLVFGEMFVRCRPSGTRSRRSASRRPSSTTSPPTC